MKFKLFTISFVLTLTVSLSLMWLSRPKRPILRPPQLTQIGDNLYFTSQLKPQDVRFLVTQRIKTVVDLRPDGEANDQPSSTEMKNVMEPHGIRFHYIPVPHENIPDTAVKQLADVLSRDPQSTALYCRTGRRAVRTFALAEASRANGPNSDAIFQMVKAAGFSADDLRDDIAKRIANRHSNTNAR